VVPGIMGSTLYRNDRPVWEPSAGAIVGAIRSSFRSLKSLQLPDGIGDEHPNDGVTAHSLIPDIRAPLGIWTFDLGYTRLIRFLTDTFELNTDPDLGPRNLVTFPYDWRLSNRYNGHQLGQSAEMALGEWRDQGDPCADARLVFICHSMGGLVARWYVERLGGADHTKALITLGTPHRGALTALDQLVNGIRKGVGPFKLTLTELARSLPSLHQLLPEYACIAHGDHLAKTTEVTLPEVDSEMVADAMHFYDELGTARDKHRNDYELHPIGGYEQCTPTTARVQDRCILCEPTIDGNDERGDATVPRLSFTPPDLRPSSAASYYAADNHAGLIHNQAVFDQLEGILTAKDIVHRGPALHLAVEIADTLDPGEPLTVKADVTNGAAPLEVVITDHAGKPVGPSQRLLPADDGLQVSLDLPHPGFYQATVRGAGPAGVQVSPITSLITAWPNEPEIGVLEGQRVT
jgi:pimeloyl-ACP methyl ester carboxylesterase